MVARSYGARYPKPKLMLFRPRLSAAASLLAVLALGGCSDSTSPAPTVPLVLVVQHPSLDGGTGAGTLQLAKAHVDVRTADDNTVLLDTLITIGAAPGPGSSRAIAFATTGSQGQVRIEFDLTLPRSTPAEGEAIVITVDLQNSAGVTLFHAGPIGVTADPDDPPPNQNMPAAYVGTGSTATSVGISPPTVSVAPGATFDFTGTARDAAGNALADTPIEWTSLQPTVATVPDKATGHVVAGTARGVATIRATLVTGQTADATLTVQPPATTVASQSGNGQTAVVATVLAPFVVKVTAADGLGVSGIPVTFAIVTGTGSLSAQTSMTDANGVASSTLTLANTPGAATVTATAAGLTGSPVTFTATATTGAAAALAFTTQPAGAASQATLAPVVVEVRDALGNRVTNYSGTVTLAIDAPPAGMTLNGTVSVAAVSGVATFSNLSVSLSGTGLRLRATATGITGSTLSNPFTITAGVAVSLVITQQPVSSVLSSTIRFTVEARTATGAVATEYQGNLAVGFIQRPNGGLITSVTSSGFANGVATLDVGVNLVGSYIFVLTAPGLTQAFSGLINVSVASIIVSSGNAQGAQANTQLPQLLVAQVLDGSLAPVAGVTVTWTVVQGNGTIVTVNGVSDAGGLVSARWTLGAAGAQIAQAQIGTGPSVQFTATIVP